MIKVSDYIASFFAENNMRHIFSISGAGNVHLLKSIAAHPDLVSVHPHQEQAGVLASLAYYRISGRLGVMITTSGGAATNAITGALDAWADSIPCIIISGQEKTEFVKKHQDLRMWGVQGFDIAKTVDNITKYATLVLDPEKIRYELEKAVYTALSGRPGPVWIDIPTDVQAVSVDPSKLAGFTPDEVKARPGAAELEQVAALIRDAKRPVFVFGNGIRLSGAVPLLEQFIEKYKAPFLLAWNGVDMISTHHPLNYGREGTYGQRCANFVIQNADLVVTIGTRMAIPQVGYDVAEFAREAQKVMVDIDETELAKFSAAAGFHLIKSDAADFLEGMLEQVDNPGSGNIAEWITQCDHWKIKYPYVDETGLHKEADGYLNSYSFIKELNHHFSDNEIIVTDMGTALTCTHQSIQLNGKQRIVTSTGLGEMGYGLPGAVGASLAADGQRVILINGDGSMMMNLQEMQTIRHLNLPIKLFVYVNDGYLTIKHTQFNLFGNNYAGSGVQSGVSCPDFELVGKAFGFKTFKIKSLAEAQSALDAILQEDGPVLCEVFIHPMQPLVPKTSFNINPDGTLVSPPLEDLYPFLTRKELEDDMIIDLHSKSKQINN